jgi:hypothetical protein
VALFLRQSTLALIEVTTRLIWDSPKTAADDKGYFLLGSTAFRAQITALIGICRKNHRC